MIKSFRLLPDALCGRLQLALNLGLDVGGELVEVAGRAVQAPPAVHVEDGAVLADALTALLLKEHTFHHGFGALI